jgi:hypothetical protein
MEKVTTFWTSVLTYSLIVTQCCSILFGQNNPVSKHYYCKVQCPLAESAQLAITFANASANFSISSDLAILSLHQSR